MTKYSNDFVQNLIKILKDVPISSNIKKESDLEKIIYRIIRDYTAKTLKVDDDKIDKVVFTHGVNWTESKIDQNVNVFGCSNTSDIFIKEPRLGTIYVELKYAPRRGDKGANKLSDSLQRSIGQSIIASLVHTHVICLIVCEAKRKEREKDYSEELTELLRSHNIEFIVRNIYV